MGALRTLVMSNLATYLQAGATDHLSDYGVSLAKRTLRNPYEAVFIVIEAIRQLEKVPVPPSAVPDRRAELMTGFVTTLSQTQLNAIAQTSGGNAILRQAFRVLAAGPVKNSVGNALGQRSDPGLLSLDAWRPSVAFSEPPLCRELSIQVSVTKPPKIQQFVMTFGRRIAIGADTSTPYPNAIWTGPSITGETLPETY
jgi:hypothetical protein